MVPIIHLFVNIVVCLALIINYGYWLHRCTTSKGMKIVAAFTLLGVVAVSLHGFWMGYEFKEVLK